VGDYTSYEFIEKYVDKIKVSKFEKANEKAT